MRRLTGGKTPKQLADAYRQLGMESVAKGYEELDEQLSRAEAANRSYSSRSSSSTTPSPTLKRRPGYNPLKDLAADYGGGGEQTPSGGGSGESSVSSTSNDSSGSGGGGAERFATPLSSRSRYSGAPRAGGGYSRVQAGLRTPTPRRVPPPPSPGVSPIHTVNLPSNLAGPPPPSSPSSSAPYSPSSGIGYGYDSNRTPDDSSHTVSMRMSAGPGRRPLDLLSSDEEHVMSRMDVAAYFEAKERRAAAMRRYFRNLGQEEDVANPLGDDPVHNVPAAPPAHAAPPGAAHGDWGAGDPQDPLGVDPRHEEADAEGGGGGAPPAGPGAEGDDIVEGDGREDEGGGGGGGGMPYDPAAGAGGPPGGLGGAPPGGGAGGPPPPPPPAGPAAAMLAPSGVTGGFKRPGGPPKPSANPLEDIKQMLITGQIPPQPPNEGQGDYHPPPYGDGSAFAEKARESDSDRTNPITPATGSKQTPATANSLIGADPVIASAKEHSPEEVLGTAQERANVGKGQFSGYEFSGPYDFPSRPSGRPDSSLTAVGAWRSKTGQHSSSLWRSTITEKGTPAKRDKYYRWSTKGGGGWKDLSSKEAMKTFTRFEARKQGGRWLERPNPGEKLTEMMAGTLKRKIADINEGRAGNARMNKRRKGADPSNNFQTQI